RPGERTASTSLSLTPQHSKCRLQFLNRLLCLGGLAVMLLCDLNPEVSGTNQVLRNLEPGIRTRLYFVVGLNRDLERLTPGVVSSSVVLGQNLSGLSPVRLLSKKLLQLLDSTLSRFGAGPIEVAFMRDLIQLLVQPVSLFLGLGELVLQRVDLVEKIGNLVIKPPVLLQQVEVLRLQLVNSLLPVAHGDHSSSPSSKISGVSSSSKKISAAEISPNNARKNAQNSICTIVMRKGPPGSPGTGQGRSA